MRRTEDLRVNSAAKNTHNKIIRILMVLSILMFLILAVLTSLLFIKYITITEELSQMKNNVDRRTSELQRDVESLKTKRPSCENGWLEFEDHCYFFSNFELNWTNAEKMCLNRESHLVIVNSESEQTFLHKNYNKKNYWIGLTDVDNEGTFQWIDGTEVSYTSWRDREPNGGTKENCANLYKDRKWNDYDCNINNHAICEKRLL
ncbi:hepatic lectin-like isoform X2 [Rana temporaria]|uniref:hepatic lectin-like isoform X2 n=1 Tax=Rana temporaria TaxID=8407 RepID=UPI001AACB345|nr:hepatic lectin-like isoform X2 [Rana temporaria]